MLVEEIDVSGEYSGGIRPRERAAKEREEIVLESIEPVAIVILESTSILVAIEDCCSNKKEDRRRTINSFFD